jgi:ADP-heptose:LPS heptosyltransferase
MQLALHSSMGDHVIMTGIPEAFFNLYGEKTFVIHRYSDDFWNHNPYITNVPTGKLYSLRPNGTPQDFATYYPARVFQEITGTPIDKKLVQPNIYIPRRPMPHLVVMNDQSGWPSRRGYRYWNELAINLINNGFLVYYLRNDNFLDCIAHTMPRLITAYATVLNNLSIPQTIDILSQAVAYIGYASGMTSLAAALKIPLVTFYGSIPAENGLHDVTVYYTDNCDHCCADQCNKMCLTLLEDKSNEVVSRLLEIDGR